MEFDAGKLSKFEGKIEEAEKVRFNSLASPTSPVRGVEVSKVGRFFLKVGTTFR
jgi:hypothetical protein